MVASFYLQLTVGDIIELHVHNASPGPMYIIGASTGTTAFSATEVTAL